MIYDILFSDLLHSVWQTLGPSISLQMTHIILSICIYIPVIFIHSSVDGHFGCFHVLAIVNSAVINVGVHVSSKNRRPKETVLQRRHTHGQQTHERMLGITNY